MSLARISLSLNFAGVFSASTGWLTLPNHMRIKLVNDDDDDDINLRPADSEHKTHVLETSRRV